jgi:predicted transposase YbfD/YdcC
VINALDAELFKACFVAWVEALREKEPDIIAIDGKTSRRSHARGRGCEPLRLVSAWAARQRLVLGQEAVDEKSNEILAIPLLLERLEQTGALVTIDAMGTQTDIAEKIVTRGGDYLLALKANRPLLHQEVAAFFDNPPAEMLQPEHKTTDGDHGRIEMRRHVVCRQVNWLFSDRPYADEPRFPHLAMIGMVETASSETAPSQASDAIICLPPNLTPRPLPPPFAPIGGPEPLTLGPRRHLSGRSRAPEDRLRTAKHGRRQTHGHEYGTESKRQTQPQSQKKTRKPQPRLPRNPHPSQPVNLKRIPCHRGSAPLRYARTAC